MSSKNGKEPDARTATYKTSRGHTVTLQPIPLLATGLLRQEFIETHGDFPKPPTYLSPTDEVLVHKESTLETDEDRAAWQEYQEAMAKWETEFMTFQFDYIGLEAVIADDNFAAIEESWARKQRARGIRVSDDPYERRIKIIRSEVFTTPNDLAGVSRVLAELSGAPPSEVAKLEKTFRG